MNNDVTYERVKFLGLKEVAKKTLSGARMWVNNDLHKTKCTIFDYGEVGGSTIVCIGFGSGTRDCELEYPFFELAVLDLFNGCIGLNTINTNYVWGPRGTKR